MRAPFGHQGRVHVAAVGGIQRHESVAYESGASRVTWTGRPVHPAGGDGGWYATELGNVSQPQAKIVIIGGGPGGYEAALVAAQLGADVTVVDRDGLGGACVLTDCVPSKTLIATSGLMAALDGSARLGIRLPGAAGKPAVDAPRLYARVRSLAAAQSADVASRLAAEGV
ncbi:MAG: FAD-dependent oxidoreductase, partial [Actinomycetota bacterium]